MSHRLTFDLPPGLEASEPPEARGINRDGVRMMVARRRDLQIEHTTFALLPAFLEPGDLVVINTSATMAAAIVGVDPVGGDCVPIHLSSHLEGDEWAVEPRCRDGSATARWPADGPPPPKFLRLGEDGSTLELLGPYRQSRRLWRARLRLAAPAPSWLAVHGRPIRYEYVDRPWPLSAYQNVYATEPGSAEMPSAGRPFTPEVITRLVAKGVGVSPVVLHTGVASLEADELPYPERVEVPAATARTVNLAKAAGGRVIAVGTTTVRALESAFDPARAEVRSLDGWTDLVVSPEEGVHVVDGTLTGWHEPAASHLLMLEAVAGRPLLEASYAASLSEGYLWHEFGDVHLILP
jgi:S-adenosylmethionine:tRNA ribosyltransferase-isomerase